MIISHSKKFIFVHIHKTAGTSVEAELLPHARAAEKFAIFWPSKYFVRGVNKVLGWGDYGNKWVTGLHRHSTARQARDYLGAERFAAYFSFAFVRNPWDWQVSLYHFIRGNRAHVEHGVANDISFADFARREIANAAPRQSDFILDEDGAPLVNFVGRLENLDADFAEICSRVGIPPRPPRHANKSERRRDYREYYDEELKNLVADYYRRDIETFGYDF